MILCLVRLNGKPAMSFESVVFNDTTSLQSPLNPRRGTFKTDLFKLFSGGVFLSYDYITSYAGYLKSNLTVNGKSDGNRNY
jgi:hypothetical protein